MCSFMLKTLVVKSNLYINLFMLGGTSARTHEWLHLFMPFMKRLLEVNNTLNKQISVSHIIVFVWLELKWANKNHENEKAIEKTK